MEKETLTFTVDELCVMSSVLEEHLLQLNYALDKNQPENVYDVLCDHRNTTLKAFEKVSQAAEKCHNRIEQQI